MSIMLARPLPAAAPAPALLEDLSRFRVEPVIETMHACLEQPLSLNELADVAGWSPFHFHRLFRAAVGIPPNEFLTTLRLQEAKRLLLTTPASVTDICYAVGYASLGTFTARFTHLVGAAPGRLRQFANTVELPPAAMLGELRGAPAAASMPADGISGEIRAPADLPGPIFLGLFPKPIPQARPVSGTVLTAPGRYRLAAPPDGRYHLLAAAVPWAEDPRVPSLPAAGSLVGVGAEPLLVQHGRSRGQANVALRIPAPTDPPVLTCLPLLLAESCLALRSLIARGAGNWA